MSMEDKSTGGIGVDESMGGRKTSTGFVELGRRWPPHAVHPITGGMPPTTAPTHVLAILLLFVHV